MTDQFPWPFRSSRFRMVPGLQPLSPADWLVFDADHEAQLAERAELLGRLGEAVLRVLPGAEGAACEAAALVLAHLAGHAAHRFRLQDGNLHDLATGAVWPPVLASAAHLVTEDLCLLQPGADGLTLSAGAVCFPNRWQLADKIGRSLPAIHAPVPAYAASLAKPVDRLMTELSSDRPVWRTNWSLADDPALHQPVETAVLPPDLTLDAGNAGARLWLRVERQTLRRLPACGGVLFTIRTFLRPLSWFQDQPEAAAQFAAVLRDVPPGMARYKGLHRTGAAALAYLDGVAPPGVSPTKGSST